MKKDIVVLCQTPNFVLQANALASQLNLPMVTSLAPKCDYFLQVTDAGLQLASAEDPKQKPLRIDFLHGKLAYRQAHSHGVKQPLAKAVGCKAQYRPTVIDATAGLGRDGFLLAALGCEVQMLERSPILAALLADGVARLRAAQPEFTLSIIAADAIDHLQQVVLPTHGQPRPDVVYIDPMYPARKKSALVKKEMRWVRDLVGDDMDSVELLSAALGCARKRVVVKRPKTAASIGEGTKMPQPGVQFNTPTQRFDVYLLNVD